MAFQNCQSCFKITGATVEYAADDEGLVLTVQDPCCRYNTCKAIKGVLVSALKSLYENELITESQLSCACCCNDFAQVPLAVWTFGTKSVTIPGDFDAVSPASGEFDVDAGFAPGV